VTPPPGSLPAMGVTHWSSRRLADWLRRNRKMSVSHDSIARLWRRFCLQPHRTEGFKFSTDPHLDAKITDVVGLYLHPPENAVVVCVDEKSQCLREGFWGPSALGSRLPASTFPSAETDARRPAW
jgi:hypothetical protein